MRSLIAFLPQLCRMSSLSYRDGHDIHLDMLRGLSALLVMLNHLRAFVFVDFKHIGSPSIVAKLFYFFTGFGHQAVVVFFVLSGYFVAGNVYRRIADNRWHWGEYAIDRLSRLWVVLLSALCLTYAWDYLGMLTGSLYYTGAMQGIYHSGPNPGQVDISFSNFIANLAFLQTIVTTTYGTNGPLWSLANEFFYYVLFPCLALVFSTTHSLQYRFCHAGIFMALAWFLPFGILSYMLIWMMGFFVWWLKVHFVWKNYKYIWIFPALCVFALQVAQKLDFVRGDSGDFVLGIIVSVLVLILPISLQNKASYYAKIAKNSSNMSYTLYLTHFPLLGFFCAHGLEGKKLNFDIHGISLYFFLMLAVLIYSYGLYFLAERHTPQIRSRLKILLIGGRDSPRQQPRHAP